MQNTTVLRHKPSYILEKIDQEILLYNPKDTRAVYLNETSVLIWQLIDGERSVEEIVQLITDEFPDSPGLSAEIQTALDGLLRNEVLQEVSSGQAASQSPRLADPGRRSLARVLATGGATLSSGLLPRIWVAPIVGSVVVPAHAQTSEIETTTTTTTTTTAQPPA